MLFVNPVPNEYEFLTLKRFYYVYGTFEPFLCNCSSVLLHSLGTSSSSTLTYLVSDFWNHILQTQIYLNDTGGGERFRTLTSNFYRNASAAILMYSVEDHYTFENLQEWVENAQDSVDPDKFVWAVVGNKSDLPLEIEHETIRAFCDKLGTELNYFTSAKTGENVQSTLNDIVKAVHRKWTNADGDEEDKRRSQSIKIGRTNRKEGKSSCCGRN